MYDSGANVHIVASLDMLEEMIKAAGFRVAGIRRLANNDLIDHGVKGINPKGRLRPTHRYHIGTFGHVLVAPEVEQHIKERAT